MPPPQTVRYENDREDSSEDNNDEYRRHATAWREWLRGSGSSRYNSPDIAERGGHGGEGEGGESMSGIVAQGVWMEGSS